MARRCGFTTLLLLALVSGSACGRLPETKIEDARGQAISVDAISLGRALATVESGAASGPVPVSDSTMVISAGIAEAFADKSAAADRSRFSNAYRIEIEADSIAITAQDRTGLLYAIDHLNSAAGDGELREGTIVNWGDHETRVLHFLLRNLTEAEAITLLNKARQARFNTVILHLADGVRLESPAVQYRDDALSKEAFLRIVAHARDNGMEVIPGVSLLTHQHHFFKNRYPRLMFNKDTYDPRNPETMQLVFGYLDELLGAIKPRAIHIGHDEVAGLTPESQRKKLKPGEEPLPADLFLMHVNAIARYLHDRNIEPWMWGDMLIAPNEFRQMHQADMNADAEYAALRRELPGNIVINDWHYYQRWGDFKTLDAFATAGNDVLGTSWKNATSTRAFSRYAITQPRCRGMIATTWFHVQKKEWDLVDTIISDSGAAFWHATD